MSSLIKDARLAKKRISKASLSKNLPYPLFAKEGDKSSLW
jgi:hypothetical protein